MRIEQELSAEEALETSSEAAFEETSDSEAVFDETSDDDSSFTEEEDPWWIEGVEPVQPGDGQPPIQQDENPLYGNVGDLDLFPAK